MNTFVRFTAVSLVAIGLSACSDNSEQTESPVAEGVATESVEVAVEPMVDEVVTVQEATQQVIRGYVMPYQSLPELVGDDVYQLTVALQDVSLMDVKATEITSVKLSAATFPIAFELQFDTELDARMSYGLSARVNDATGNLVAINDTAHRYMPSSTADYDVLVKPINQAVAKPNNATLTCADDSFAMNIYDAVLVLTDIDVGNSLALPRVRSASGTHYKREGFDVFMKGDNPPLITIDGQRVDCSMSNS